VSALPGGGPVVVSLHPPDPEPTRERLLRAAREVVEAHGYGGASVAAISTAAGVATGTLYRHFGSKAELFVEVFRDVCGRELDAMRAAAARSDAAPGSDLVDRVLAPLEVFARRALQNRALAWALLAEPVDAQVDEVRLEYRRTYRELLAGLLAEAVDAGALPPQDPALTAAALVGAVGEVLVGPLSASGARGSRDPAAAVGGPVAPTGDPVVLPVGAPAAAPVVLPVGAAHGAPSADVADPDGELLAGLRDVCRRAMGAASRVRADASGEPR
jgi:AcrR family transcriptional regulator